VQHVPKVVEASVRVLGVLARHLGQAEPAFVHEDEGIDPFVRHRAGRERLQDRHSHHPDQRRVLHEAGLTLRFFNLLPHVAHLPAPFGSHVAPVRRM
jgi:hypothetical protein